MSNTLTCCVSGCRTRHTSKSKRRLYRIPSGSGPYQAYQRQLWVEAIQRANGSTDELEGNVRICSAHFKSRQVSMYPTSPSFAPTVFRGSRARALRQRAKRQSNVEMEEQTTPPRVDSLVDLHPYVLMKVLQTQSTPSMPQGGETLTKEPETETTPVKCEASPSVHAPAGMPKLDKSLIVLLKHIYVPASGYRCEQCDESFPETPQLMKHKRLHDEEISVVCEKCGTFFASQPDLIEHQCVPEPSLPCNVCDRTFTTSYNLKRHKLLHVKDGRKCPTCSVLFCQRHNHILYRPSAPTITEYEEDPATAKPKKAQRSLMPETRLLVLPEPSQNADLDPDALSNKTVLPGPLSTTRKTPASPATISSEIHVPVFPKAPSASGPPPLLPEISREPKSSKKPPDLSWSRLLRPNRPETFVQPLLPKHSELPPSLKIFSPLYLRSALLEVTRNYEYILSKPVGVKKNIVKEEQSELPLIPPD